MNQLPAPTQMQGLAQPTKFHDVKVIKRKTVGRVRVQGVPPEECGIERQARSIKDCGYFFHRVIRRQSDLISEGFNEDDVKVLPTYVTQTGVEELARDTVFENTGTGGDKGINVANRFVRIIEHYVRMDYEQNGKVKLYRVVTGGEIGQVLRKNGKMEIVEEDDICFASATPVPVTHRFFGRSIADLVIELQKIKTALLRGLLDNTYLAVNQRPEVAEALAGESTLDDLLVSRPGAPIRTQQPGCVTWQNLPFIGEQLLPIIGYIDQEREWRSGVSRQAQGPNADALQNTPATTAQILYTAAQTKMKLIARIFAETGVRDLFSLIHETARKHTQEALTVKLRGQWVPVDPRTWKRRDDMTIAVGLGPGTKETQMAAQQLIIGAQKEGVGAGLVSKQNLFNSAAQLTKLAGHKSPDDFFVDPSKPSDPNNPAAQPIQPPPDPKMAEIQMKGQLDQQAAQNKAKLDLVSAQQDAQHQQQKNGAEIALAQQKAQFQMELEAFKAKVDAEMKEREFTHKQRMADMDFAHQSRMGELNMAHKQKLGEFEAQNKAQQQPAKASVEFKHDTGVHEAIGALTKHITDSHAALLKQMSAPKRVVRDAQGRASHVETMQ